MQELMLINPRRRRRRGRRRMSALQRSYFGGGRKHRRRRSRVTALASNPVHRRRSRRRHRHVMRLRRNPSLRSATSSLMSGIVPAVTGAGGALAVDYVLNNFGPQFLPASFMQGPLYPVTKVAAAFGIGMIAGKVAGRAVGNQVLAGALVVTAYDLIKGFLAVNAPSLGLSRYVGNSGRMGRYVANNRLGYFGPGMSAGRGAFPSNVRMVVP